MLPLGAAPATFSKDIAPIVFGHCSSCHRPGEAAPFSLLSYGDVRKHAKLMVEVTKQRYMPPWMPLPGHGKFKDSARLSDGQIALLSRWFREGMLEGNRADLPPIPRFSEGWQLGKPDLILRLRQPFRLPATESDIFRNFILPVDLKESKYIRAFELRPGNKRVVHHANIILDRSRLLRRRDGNDGQPGFGGMDVETGVTGEFDPDSHFLFWKPGSAAQQEPAGMAWRLDPGADLILNLHLQPSGKPEFVQAELGLYFTAEAPTRHPMLLQLEHDGAIDIHAGDASFQITDYLKLPVGVKLLEIYPHAHYLGKQIEAWAELPNGSRLRLLKIDRWDINWQAAYSYRQPVSLPAGTTVKMRITYDNTAGNVRNPNQPPQRVTFGNRSRDEMGHVWMQVLPDGKTGEDANSASDPRLILQQATMRRRIEKYPADFVAHFNLGAAFQAEGKPEEALPYLLQSVHIRPSDVMARNNLAVALFALQRFDAAVKEFREALSLDPESRDARYNLSRAFAAKGDHANALQELRTHLQGSPDDAEAHEFTAELLASTGRLREALPHLKRAAVLDPGNAAFAANLGLALASSGDFVNAITAFERAIRLDPLNDAVRQNLERARSSLNGKNQ